MIGPGRRAQLASLLEVMAPKPGNVHRSRDLPGLTFLDFLASATAIGEALDSTRHAGIGPAVERAVIETRKVVATNTNLGMVLLLAPMTAVPDEIDLQEGLHAVLETTTIEDARAVYRAIRLAHPGGMGTVPDQDIADEPTLPLREVMAMAADRDLVARQYANGYREVLNEALPAIAATLRNGWPVDTAVVAAHLRLLANHPDSLITRKAGLDRAREVSERAEAILSAGWPERPETGRLVGEFDDWLRHPDRQWNPGTTADLVTAALYAALRDGTIPMPVPSHRAG